MGNETIARHCIAQKKITYNVTRINNGQNVFMPGDDVFVLLPDFPRMARQGKISSAEKDIDVEDIARKIDFENTFPKRSPVIWVWGDGPTAAGTKKYIKKDHIVFAVNHCFYKPLELTPDYYVALDDGMLSKEPDKIRELKSVRKFTNRTNQFKIEDSSFRFFDVRGETGFSTELLELYHGKTSCFVALQLAVQCGQEFIKSGELEIHLGGIDLATLKFESKDLAEKEQIMTHHYGTSAFQESLFPRMLSSIRYGLNFLNEAGIKWVNHSPLLASRVEDLQVSKEEYPFTPRN